jgi:hypothetical protein
MKISKNVVASSALFTGLVTAAVPAFAQPSVAGEAKALEKLSTTAEARSVKVTKASVADRDVLTTVSSKLGLDKILGETKPFEDNACL